MKQRQYAGVLSFTKSCECQCIVNNDLVYQGRYYNDNSGYPFNMELLTICTIHWHMCLVWVTELSSTPPKIKMEIQWYTQNHEALVF